VNGLFSNLPYVDFVFENRNKPNERTILLKYFEKILIRKTVFLQLAITVQFLYNKI